MPSKSVKTHTRYPRAPSLHNRIKKIGVKNSQNCRCSNAYKTYTSPTNKNKKALPVFHSAPTLLAEGSQIN